MDHYDVKRLALVLAIQAEIEGMKADNKYAAINNQEPRYHQGHFQEKAQELIDLANKPNEQL